MARKIGPQATALIKQYEGLRLKAYPDPATGGKPYTIGYGATRDAAGKPIAPGTVWTKAEADAAFTRDIARFESAVEGMIDNNATDNAQFGALVSLAYNVGERNLRTSTLLRKHNAGDYKGAQSEFARWNRANGKPMPGLTRRRAAEAELYGLYR